MATVRVRDRACVGCGSTDYNAYDYERSICKPCRLKRRRDYMKKNAGRGTQYMRRYKEKYRKENPIRWWAQRTLDNLKTRAKKNGDHIDLDRDFLESIAVEKCPVLGIPICYTNDRHRDDSPSLDRLYPEKGYTRDNVNVISNRANRIKADGTLEELEAVVSWIKRLTNEATIS